MSLLQIFYDGLGRTTRYLSLPCHKRSSKIFSTSPSSFNPSRTLTLSCDEEKTLDKLATDILSCDDVSSEARTNQVNNGGNMQRRIALSKAITLVESKSPIKRFMADLLFDRIRQNVKKDGLKSVPAFRLGIAGPPGSGKSTFVDALGLYILGLRDKNMEKKHPSAGFVPEKIAVLCVDPSSHITGGSILGDKTRMSNLAYHPRAYVRPSPSSGNLGGLGAYTFDAVSLCEYAGYQLTIVETVGVGQSEVELAECCDLFLLLLAPGGGDELQGSKKGIIEVADVLVVNKADGDLEYAARNTASEYRNAMRLLSKPVDWWGGNYSKDSSCSSQEGLASKNGKPTTPPVLLISAKTGLGIPELWETIDSYRKYAQSTSCLMQKRQKQNRYWMYKYLTERLVETTKQNDQVKEKAINIEKELDSGLIAPRIAAEKLWKSIVSKGNDKVNRDD